MLISYDKLHSKNFFDIIYQSERIIKTEHRDGQQKWRCKDSWKFQEEKDRRERYGEKEKLPAINLYLEGCGFRRIARIFRCYSIC